MSILLDGEEIMSHIRDIYPEEIPFGVFALVTESIQAQLKKVVEWQEAKCAEHPEHNACDDGLHFNLRRDCPQCMQALKEEAGL